MILFSFLKRKKAIFRYESAHIFLLCRKNVNDVEEIPGDIFRKFRAERYRIRYHSRKMHETERIPDPMRLTEGDLILDPSISCIFPARSR
jgi:hypothetical protein